MIAHKRIQGIKVFIQYIIYYIRQIFAEYDDPILLWLIYVYNSVVQTLWLVSADKTKKYSKRIWLVPAEPSTIYGGSNSSACSLKALNILAVNPSTEETIHASWDSGLSSSVSSTVRLIYMPRYVYSMHLKKAKVYSNIHSKSRF